jgi:hypothetical protein
LDPSTKSEFTVVTQTDDLATQEAPEKARKVPLSLAALDDDHIVLRSQLEDYGIPKFSRPHQKRLVDAGLFPAPIEYSAQRIGWRAGDLKSWRASLRTRAGWMPDRAHEGRPAPTPAPKRSPAPAPAAIPEDVPLIDRSISSLAGLTRRMRRALEREGIHTVRDLVQKSPGELLRMREVGALTIDTVCRALDAVGLRLGMEKEMA